MDLEFGNKNKMDKDKNIKDITYLIINQVMVFMCGENLYIIKDSFLKISVMDLVNYSKTEK
jgi:hypothetical protein